MASEERNERRGKVKARKEMRRKETWDSKERKGGKRPARLTMGRGRRDRNDLCGTMPPVITSSLSCLNRCARTASTHYTT